MNARDLRPYWHQRPARRPLVRARYWLALVAATSLLLAAHFAAR